MTPLFNVKQDTGLQVFIYNSIKKTVSTSKLYLNDLPAIIKSQLFYSMGMNKRLPSSMFPSSAADVDSGLSW